MRVLRRPAVEDLTGLARSTIYSLMGRGLFPRPIELAGASTVGWLEDEVIGWIEARVKNRDARTPRPAPELPSKRRRGRPRKVRTESLEHSA